MDGFRTATQAGGVRDLIDATPWEGHVLGARAGWPPCLEIVLSLCCSAGQPQAVWWGPGHLLFPNDAFAALLGERYPQAFGARAVDRWPELGSVFESILATGVGVRSEARHLLAPGVGADRLVASHSPITDAGVVVGVLTTLLETGTQVVASRRLDVLGRVAAIAARTDLQDAAGTSLAVLEACEADVALAVLCNFDEGGVRVRVRVRVRGAVRAVHSPVLGFQLSTTFAAAAGRAQPLMLEPVPSALTTPPGVPPVAFVLAWELAPDHGAERTALLLGVGPDQVSDADHRIFLGALATAIGAAGPPATRNPTGPPPQDAGSVARREPLLASAAPHSAPSGTDAFTGRRILLAASPDVGRPVAELLESYYEIDSAPDGQAALAAAVYHPPEVVLCDVMLEQFSSRELAAKLRAEPRTAHVPIVLLAPRGAEDATGTEADDYVVTPVVPAELLARIGAAIRGAEAREEAVQQALATTSHLRELMDAMLVVSAARTASTALEALCEQARMMLAAAQAVVETRHGWRAASGAAPAQPGDRMLVPIRSTHGVSIGTLCVTAQAGATFDPADRLALRQLARAAGPSLNVD